MRRGGAAPGPAVAAAVNSPVLQQRSAILTLVDATREMAAAAGTASIGSACQRSGLRPFQIVEEAPGIGGVNDGVIVAMKHDGRQLSRQFFF